jgi:hypothetical protein
LFILAIFIITWITVLVIDCTDEKRAHLLITLVRDSLRAIPKYK